jgi:NAD(P)-dependent dehydrogenase (short-subunit alcohol dehydrogenase family)
MHGENADKGAGLHLINRIGEVEEVAHIVYAVAKNKYVTGAIIKVDGGMGAGHHLN